MSPAEFQAFVMAWGAALTTLIAVLVTLALSIKGALQKIFESHAELSKQVAVNTESINHANGNGHTVAPPQNQAP